MSEILQSGARGISREELCSKWTVSSMNDYPGEEISERIPPCLTMAKLLAVVS